MSNTYDVLNTIFGWSYFFLWSFSFYPQLYTNFRRKSVSGFSIDFAVLNVIGFLCYSIFNLCFYYVPIFRQELSTNTTQVEFNDVAFSLHAFFMSSLTAIQCLIYERGDQILSIAVIIFAIVVFELSQAFLILAIFGFIKYIQFAYFLSNVKLVVTLTKYIPQAWLNFKRKSTVGMNILNILLDFSGGLLSISQMFMICILSGDWTSIFNNFTKLGLALFSIGFDMIFIIQHYVLYKRSSSDSFESILTTQRVNNTY